jgi:hypothetical protein
MMMIFFRGSDVMLLSSRLVHVFAAVLPRRRRGYRPTAAHHNQSFFIDNFKSF